jgi:ribonuclease E
VKRSEPQRRRRTRSRKPEAEKVAVAADTDMDNAASAVDENAASAATATATAPTTMETTAPFPATAAQSDLADASNTKPDASAPAVKVVADSDDHVDTGDGWEPVPVSRQEATDEAVAEATNVAPLPQTTQTAVAISPTVTPAAAAEPVSRDGITANGRAINDPRVEARPVGVVECTTSHRTLFSEVTMPPAQSSNRVMPRASNDPRGPAPQVIAAQAAGQS